MPILKSQFISNQQILKPHYPSMEYQKHTQMHYKQASIQNEPPKSYSSYEYVPYKKKIVEMQ